MLRLFVVLGRRSVCLPSPSCGVPIVLYRTACSSSGLADVGDPVAAAESTALELESRESLVFRSGFGGSGARRKASRRSDAVARS
jgi:hypothetical protein